MPQVRDETDLNVSSLIDTWIVLENERRPDYLDPRHPGIGGFALIRSATAEAAAAKGARLVLAARSAEALEALAARLNADGGRAIAVTADVGRREDVERFGRIDTWVNDAGVSIYGRLDEAPVTVTLIQPTAVDTPYPQHAKNYMTQEPRLPSPQIAPEEAPRLQLSVDGALEQLHVNRVRLLDAPFERRARPQESLGQADQPCASARYARSTKSAVRPYTAAFHAGVST